MNALKMYSLAVVVSAALALSAAESEVALSGVVTDGKNPVEMAVVTLVSDSTIRDTTDADGKFSIATATGTVYTPGGSVKNSIAARLRGNRLYFTMMKKNTSGTVQLYTAGGKCVLRYSFENNSTASQVIDLPERSTGLYLVRFSADNVSAVQKLIVTASALHLCGGEALAAPESEMQRTGRTCDAVDQLRLTKEGYGTKSVEVESYKEEELRLLFEPESIATATSLWKRYQNFFAIGAAVDAGTYRDSHSAVWKEHFNAMVCENEMKWSALQPSEGSFQYSTADAMVNAARSSGMLVRGHVPVWFDMTPGWAFSGSKEQVLGRMRTHITNVLQKFKGRVYAWDVVNEAVVPYDASGNDIGEELENLDHWGYRNSGWYNAAGEDHIIEAFKSARAADPDARLFYNDYWNYLDGKRAFIISFVKKLQAQNCIDGIGLQCHLNISAAQEKKTNQSAWQTVENLEKEIREYAALGLDVHITELDISIYTRDYPSTDQSKWFTGSDLNEEYQNKLAARYKAFFDMFRRNADIIQNVTLWGISDDNTWLSEFESGRPDHPLLFDKHLKPKKAFDAIMNF